VSNTRATFPAVLGTFLLLFVVTLLTGCSFDVTIGADAARDGEVYVDAADVAVGDCYDDPAVEGDDWVEVEDVRLVPCDEPHDNEAFHRFSLHGGDYPTDDAFDASFEETCIPAFEDFVGRSYEDSELDIAYLAPTADGWDEGDREVVCSVYTMDLSKLRGSMEGSGR
jgi:hypothetical protein